MDDNETRDDESHKLFPEWSRSSEEQIIALGLIVVIVALVIVFVL